MIDRRRFVTRLLRGAAAAAALAPISARAAQRFEVDRPFRTGAELVPTAVTVRDRNGRLVTDLERDAFEVQEAGIPQPITQFTREVALGAGRANPDLVDQRAGQSGRAAERAKRLAAP